MRTISEPLDSSDDNHEAPVWEHQDIDIDMGHINAQKTEAGPAKYTIYFDGACKKTETAGGFIIMSNQRVIDGRFAKYSGEVKTNNKAEITAVRDALVYFQGRY